jgi:uncharacterized protein (DUF1697 family)
MPRRRVPPAARPVRPQAPRPGAVAFLRGVNVGGHHVVRTPDLLRTFEELGLREVSVFRASGNIRFVPERFDRARLEARISRALSQKLGGNVEAFVRSSAEVEAISRLDPWRRGPAVGEVPYVSLLSASSPPHPTLPQSSPRGDVELVSVNEREAYCWGRRVGSLPGFPNAFVERVLGVSATTRNRSTLLALAGRSR